MQNAKGPWSTMMDKRKGNKCLMDDDRRTRKCKGTVMDDDRQQAMQKTELKFSRV